MAHLHLLHIIIDACTVERTKERKEGGSEGGRKHISPHTDGWKGKGMNIYIMLSIVREVCPRILESMKKDPLSLSEDIRKNVHREDNT